MQPVEKIRQRFFDEPTIMSQLPLHVPDESGKDSGFVDELVASCASCGQIAETSLFRGKISKSFGSLNIDGHAICTKCQTIYPLVIRYRVRNGRFEATFINPEGKWMKIQEPKNWKEKLLVFLHRQFRRKSFRSPRD